MTPKVLYALLIIFIYMIQKDYSFESNLTLRSPTESTVASS